MSQSPASLEFDDGGDRSVWYERAAKTLRQRQSELKKVAALAQKASQEEAQAEAAADDAHERVEQANEELKMRTEAHTNAVAARIREVARCRLEQAPPLSLA